MADPPSYDESISQPIEKYHELDGDAKAAQRFSIREEVALSRSQHVAALVERLLPPIRERARSGISKTSMLLIPSDQETSSRGQLVGFPDDDRPILIQLEGRYDSTQFWSQQEALDLLREQTLAAVAGDIPQTQAIVEPLPERPAQQSRSSFWGRKSSQPAGPSKPAPRPSKPPVSVEVQSEQANFRTETEYGLYETVRGRAVLLIVDVR